MGLLDDAIRDHLELKRRHGADPSEVARLEHEALGPARREPVAPAAPPEDDDVLYQDEAELIYDEPAAGADVLEPTAADERIEELAEADEPVYDDDLYAVDEDEADVPASSLSAGEPEPPAGPAAADEDDEGLVDQPTRRYSIDEPEDRGTARVPPEEDEPATETEPGRDDVLEETPDFLQETPEHDRLWFEQKPPRDFDF
jgi:hypothetical protein